MQIGMLVTEATYADTIIAVTKAALQKGHSVRLFMTDEGVNLAKNNGVMDLGTLRTWK